MPILGRWHEAKSLIWQDNESPSRSKSAVVKTYPISTTGLVCIDYRRHVPAANFMEEACRLEEIRGGYQDEKTPASEGLG